MMGFKMNKSSKYSPKMSRTERATAKANALAMVGSDCFHDGEHGTVILYVGDYAEPMLRVQFGSRIATLKPTEIGSK